MSARLLAMLSLAATLANGCSDKARSKPKEVPEQPGALAVTATPKTVGVSMDAGVAIAVKAQTKPAAKEAAGKGG